MAREAKKLDAATIKAAKPADKPFRLADGDGLSLLVTPDGGKFWRFRYRRPDSGSNNELSLGTYPELPLAEARDKLTEARNLVAKGIDPSRDKKAKRRAAREAMKAKRTGAPDSFKALADAYLNSQKAWTRDTRNANAQRLEAFVCRYTPKGTDRPIGSLPVGQVTVAALCEALTAIMDQGKADTAWRVRSLVGSVLRYAKQHSHPTLASADDLRGSLGSKPKTNGFAAITDPVQVGGLLRAIDAYPGANPVVSLALRLLPFLLCRPGELREARWSEFQLDGVAPQWIIPAGTAKMRREHIVPLSKPAVAILRALRPHSDGELVCPSVRVGRPISENTLNNALDLLRDRGTFAGEHDPHGFRKTASTLLHEAGFDHRVIEAQLAHKEPGVSGIYNRALYLDERRRLMEVYGGLLEGLKSGRPWHELIDEQRAGGKKAKSTQARKSAQGSAHRRRGAEQSGVVPRRTANAEPTDRARESASEGV